MRKCPKCQTEKWDDDICELCNEYTVAIEPNEPEYVTLRCEVCDSAYEDYSEPEYQSHQECEKIINQLFCRHGCDKNGGHDYLVGPVIPLVSGELPGGYVSKGILFDCPNCKRISVPVKKYSWGFSSKENYDCYRNNRSQFINGGWKDGTIHKISHGEVPSISYSRCGFCGCAVRGRFDSLISPFSVILSCEAKIYCHAYFAPSNIWIDCIEDSLERRTVQEIGVANNLRYYSTDCPPCGEKLYFVSDMDLLQDHLIWNEEEAFLCDSDDVWLEDDAGDWGPTNGWDTHHLNPSPNFRRSTHFVNKIPILLHQVQVLPDFDKESDFNKSDFNKGV
jgi:hypothetical protein